VVFEAAPYIVELFPFLIAIPMIVAMIVGKFLRGMQAKPNDASSTMKKVKWVILGPFALIALAFFLFLTLAATVSSEIYGELAMFSFTLFQGSITVGVGIVSGIILIGAYETLGVSAFLVVASFFLIFPLATIYTGTAEGAIGFAINTIDYLFIFFLANTLCCGRFTPMFGMEDPTPKGEAVIYQRIGGKYIIDVVEKLNLRISTDDDQTAKEGLMLFQETEGELGVFIKKVLQEGVPHSSYSGTTGVDSFGARSKMLDKSLKPSGTWTLTNEEFSQRVVRNRILYFIFLIPLVILATLSLADLSLQQNQWTLILTGGIILLSIPLAAFDRLLKHKRMDVDQLLKAAIGQLYGIDSKMLETEIVVDSPVLENTTEAYSFEESPPSTSPPKEVPKDSVKHGEFLERVNACKDDVYTESYKPVYLAGAGFIMVMPTAMVLFLNPIADSINLFNLFLLAICILGIPFIIAGAAWWYKLITATSFYGIRRGILSMAISYLDAKECGIENIGMVLYPPPPRQFVFIGIGGPNAVRYTLERLEKNLSIRQDPSIARKAKETEMKMMRPLAVILFFTTAIMWFIFSMPIFAVAPIFMVLFFAMLFADLVLVLSFGWSYMKSKQLDTQYPDEVQPISEESKVTTILQRLSLEYEYPLRLLVTRNHDNLYYTGRVYTTNTGVQLKEAVFLPS
jgi:hypothetical protein